MNTSNREPVPLADAVERVAASVIGVVARRQRGAAVAWREGVAVTSASTDRAGCPCPIGQDRRIRWGWAGGRQGRP